MASVETQYLDEMQPASEQQGSETPSSQEGSSIFETCTAQVGDAQNVTELLQCISDANQAVSDDKQC